MARLNIEARLHRYINGSKKYKEVVWVRHYARIETAASAANTFLMFSGQTGDVIEFTLKINGLQVGTVRFTAKNKTEFEWNRTEAAKLRNKHLMEKGDKNSLRNYKSFDTLMRESLTTSTKSH